MFFSRAAAALLAIAFAAAAPAPALTDRDLGFKWGSDKIRGVNIGGWLVLEPWITPSIFQRFNGQVVDEYTLGQTVGQDAGYTMMKQHWDSWCTLEDFQKISAAGFNLVRIPIGFWAYDTFGYPYISGAAPYMDAAIDWARKTGLKVLIDLHGAPKSQNGYDNSGQRLATPGWGDDQSVEQTHEVLKTIADKYAQPAYTDVVVGIELLNEPNGDVLNMDTVKQFFRDGYGEVRYPNQGTSPSEAVVVFHDAFQAPSSYNGFLTPSDNNAQYVAIDHHEYQVFDNTQVGWQPWEHRQHVCNNANTYAGSDKWSFVGEWTAAMTDCAAALNGYGIGARYDGTYPGSTYHGSCQNINFIETWSQQLKDDTRGYIEAQMEAFEAKTNGWIFWNFKTEASPEWDLFRLLDNKIFPQPLSSRQFDMICTNL